MRSLTIAGLAFHIRVDGPLALSPPHEAYRNFVDLTSEPGERAIEVDLLPEPETINPARLAPIVRGAESWELYADGDELLFTMRDGAGGGTLWTARCDRALTRVRIGTGLRLAAPHGGTLLTNCLQYPLDQILVMHALGGDGVIVHAGGAIRAGCGLLYGGVSGAGKTTLSRVLDGPCGFRVISDDRVAVRRTPAGLNIFGTPWAGEGGQARNDAAPLRALLFLEKGTDDRLLPLARGAALRRLLALVSIPWYDRAGLASPLDLCGEIVERVPSFLLSFAPGPAVVELLRGFCDELRPA